jgi:TonB family protein
LVTCHLLEFKSRWRKVLRGHPLFDEAAQEAVKQWRYQPLLLNGEPTAFVVTVTFPFTLTNAGG